MTNLTQTLQELKIEDFIWIIYSFIVLGALISNVLERDWVVKHEEKSRKDSKFINETIFLVTFIIYFYFVTLTYKRVKEAKMQNVSIKTLFLNEANFVAACLFLIGGAIYLFTEVASDTILSSPQQII